MKELNPSQKSSAKKIAIVLFIISAIIFTVVFLATNNSIKKTAEISKNNLTTQKIDPSKYSDAEIEILKSFQKKWADSIVKSWEGSFITDVELKLPDSIRFYLSKASSRNVAATKKNNLGVYEIMYADAKVQLPERLRNYNVIIDFLPAKGYKIVDWQHFSIIYDGIVVYTGLGNEKKRFGIIVGGIISEGKRFVQILNEENYIEIIPRKDLVNKAYYYKPDDLNIGKLINWEEVD